MPLQSGSSEKVHSQNVKEMMKAYHETGKIGNTTPRNAKHAEEIANAAAYSKARGGKRGK